MYYKPSEHIAFLGMNARNVAGSLQLGIGCESVPAEFIVSLLKP